MAKWQIGQSGNPNGRPRRGRSVAELARAISQEKVEFVDDSERALYTRLERLLRVMWTMALDGDLKAIRCLLEYMEGRPAQMVAAGAANEDVAQPMTEEQVQALLAATVARLEAWLREIEGRIVAAASGSSESNG